MFRVAAFGCLKSVSFPVGHRHRARLLTTQGVASLRAERSAMKIWVDADATPADVKRILFKGAVREEISLTLVANVPLRHPESPYLACQVVDDGFNVADDWIVEQATTGDLVVTADIPLAGRIVEKGATGLNPRGTLYTEDNIQGILATRNLMDDLRGASLIEGGGPPPYTKRDSQKFASAFNAFLVKSKNG
jgi:uncharacterized protein